MSLDVFPTLGPSLSPGVHLGLTIAFITLYTLLFLFVYVQLWMSLYYKHKRLSYRTVFLFLCLIWAGLRVTLFSFYFKNCELADNLGIFLYWLLFCLPICVQFFTLSLMVLFFVQVMFGWGRNVWHRCLLLISVSFGPAIFLITNIVCAVIVRRSDTIDNRGVVLVRVLVNDLLFIVYGLVLSACIIHLVRQHSTSSALQTEGITLRQVLVACTMILILYLSRAIYNLIVVSKTQVHLPDFGYGWLDISDQADIGNLSKGYLAFGAVLLFWEFLPTLIVVLVFRVSQPQQVSPDIAPLIADRQRPRVCFFDNPRRYDSDDDLSRAVGAGRISVDRLYTSPTLFSVNHTLRDVAGAAGGSSVPYRFSSPPSLHVPHRISHSLRQSRPLSPHPPTVHVSPAQISVTRPSVLPANVASPSRSIPVTRLSQDDATQQFYDGT